MKIAMIGQKGIPAKFGGIERHVEELSLRLGRLGHEVRVYTRAWYALPKKRLAPGVRTVATPTIRTKHLDAIVHTFTSTIDAMRWGADVIHYHGVGPSLLAWLPRLFAPRTKVVATFHCIDRKHQKWGLIARLMLGLGERAACLFPHRTIAVSKTLEAYSRDRYDCEAQYIPNGVARPPARVGRSALAAYGLEPGRYVAMVARLVRHKGAHHLIRAWHELARRGQTCGLKLVFIGDSAFTDDYVRELKNLAKGDTDIVFAGYVSGRPLVQLFAHAYCFAHPSESEGLPVAVIEAMSFGKTVVASDIPEIMEVTREHGINFKNKSVADLTRKLRHIIAHPELARKIGRTARKFVLKNYHWDDVAMATNRLYAGLIGQARAQRYPTMAASRAK